MRHKPNPEQRRRDLCDAAIRLLADGGSKGLSHVKVDRMAGLAEGTTSAYFRTRSALLCSVTERVVELDLAALESAVGPAEVSDDAASSSKLAALVIRSGVEPALTRTKARYQLGMEAARDPGIAEALHRGARAFAQVFRTVVTELVPDGIVLNAATTEELSFVAQTFISGLMSRFALGDQDPGTPEQLDTRLSAIVAGILMGEGLLKPSDTCQGCAPSATHSDFPD
jgi:AcrR family transcriptional regulator